MLTLKANDSNSSPVYLNKLVDKYNNNYNHPVGKKPIHVDWLFCFYWRNRIESLSS